MAEEMQGQDVLSRLTSFVGGNQEEATSDETPAEEPQETPEATQEEQPQETQDEGVTIDPDAPLIEITVKKEDGTDETRPWSLNELKQSVMMKQDYTRKTQEIARAREQMSQAIEQQVAQERNNYLQSLQMAEAALVSLVAPELQQVDFSKLAEENPAEAVKLQAKAAKLQQTMAALRQQQQAVQQQAVQRLAQESVRLLSDPVTGIPGWGDELYSSLISEGAKAYGFRPEEIANVVDHRLIRVLNDALSFQKAKSAKPVVKAVPKVIKPGAPSVKGEMQARNEQQLQARLKKTGDLKDAAALYLSRMKGAT